MKKGNVLLILIIIIITFSFNMMAPKAVKICHASLGENGKTNNCVAGDQSGKEVTIRSWYNKPWSYVLRPKDSEVGKRIAQKCVEAANNNKIGYDQSDRLTFYEQAKKNNWNLAGISKACEADCAAFVATCVNAAGINASHTFNCGNEKAELLKTGEFKTLNGYKYISKPDYLKAGDILINPRKHTAIVVDDGASSNNDGEGSTVDVPTDTEKLLAAISVGKKYTKCNQLLSKDVVDILKYIFLIIQIATPIIFIILSMMDFTKAIASSKKDGLSDAFARLVKRFLICAAIFLVPSLINFIIDVTGISDGVCGIN